MKKGQFDFAAFLERIEDLDPDQIVLTCQEDIRMVMTLLSRNGNRLNEASKMYLQALQGFLAFLQSPKPDMHRYNPHFPAYRPVVEKLVRKGRMDKEVLEAF